MSGKFICRCNYGGGFAAASDKRHDIAAADMEFFREGAYTSMIKIANTA